MPESLTSTTMERVTGWAFRENTGTSTSLSREVDEWLSRLADAQASAQVVRVLSHCSDITGGYVRMLPEFYCIPVLIGADNQAVPLYEFVEVLEGAIDYDSVIAELPNLTHPQINGALSFLRKLSQFNPRNIDIDSLEDEHIGRDTELIEELRRAVADKETSRVLASD